MKKHILASAFIALSVTAFAERPSTDEVAIHLGVQAWFSARSSSNGQFDFTRLPAIYRADSEFTDPATGKPVAARGLGAYVALLRPLAEQLQSFEAQPADDISISLDGATAVTAFTFRPHGTFKDGRPVTCGARVSLTWERRDGFWQIAREETTPLAPAIPAEIATAK